MGDHSVDASVADVLSRIDREETIELSRSLVRIPSVTGIEGRAISEFVLEWLRSAGLEAGLQDISADRANVYARLSGAHSGPRLLLNAHLDTKPLDGMTIDPLGAEVRNGRLYGRGSCDTKSALAASMVAMKAVAESGVSLHGTLLLGSEVGEDGGDWRFHDLIDSGPCVPDLLICGEPTGLEVHIGCRTTYPMVVRTIGRATHTGTAYEGVNAIEKMARVVLALYELPCFHREDPIWGRSPINVRAIRGESLLTGSVPDKCEATFDIRLNPDVPPADFQRDVESALARLRREDPLLDVAWTSPRRDRQTTEGEVTHLPPDHPFVQSVAKAAVLALGRPVRLGGFPGNCSAGLSLRRGIPSVIIGPGNLTEAHTVDEWVEVDQIAQAARVYAVAAARILSPDAS